MTDSASVGNDIERRKPSLIAYSVKANGDETAQVMARLYAAARLYVNFFQPSFKLKEKRREGAKIIKRYHDPATPFERALARPKVTRAVKARLRDMHRTLDPVALLAEMRAAQAELGEHRPPPWQDGRAAAGSIT